MSLLRSSLGVLPISALLMVAATSPLSAQQRHLFEWRGQVDREVRITMRGRDVWTRDIGDDDYRRHREQVVGTLPRQDGEVVVRLENGRGDVEVIQQPSARNGYTAIVRIRDPRGGADQYRLSAFWRSYTDRWDRGNGRGRDQDNRGNGNGNGVYDSDRDRGDWERDRGVDSRDRGTWGTGSNARNVMHWSGNVDDVLEIRIQGRRADYRTLSGDAPRSVQADLNGMPQRDVALRVSQRQGRGQVLVVQQPSAQNGYTAVLRIRDPQGGFGFYDFDLTW
jgi:hypothetical protein